MLFRRIFQRQDHRRGRDGNASASTSTNSAAESFREAGDRKLDEGDFHSAISFYNEAIRLSPTDGQLLLSRAVAYRLSGPVHHRFALDDANAAIQSKPDNWRAWDIKGDILAAMTEYGEAEEAYQNAIGFASNMDRPKMQSSLADVRAKKRLGASSAPYPVRTTVSQSPSREGAHELAASNSRTSIIDASTPNANRPQASTPSTASQHRSGTGFTPSEFETIGETVPTVPPPVYSASSTSTTPTIPTVSNTTIFESVLTNLILGVPLSTTATSAAMTAQNKGKLSLRAYTATQSVDAIQLLYVGLTQDQLTTRELDTSPKDRHASHNLQTTDTIVYPGNNFLDKDCEVSARYAGSIPGTTTITGYSLEYRLYQMAKNPNLQMESLRQGLPRNQLANIVSRLQNLQIDVEDNEGLKPLLGMSQIHTLQCGFGPNGRLQDRIDNICYMITRTHFDEPTRVRDFSAIGNLSSLLKPPATQPTQLRDFLFQILLGFEILIRVRRQVVQPSYSSIITYNISCMMVAASQFKTNVRIVQKPATPGSASPTYDFVPLNHNSHAQGLNKFAETIKWPFLDEAKRFIYQATSNMAIGTWPSGPDLCDFLFGLVLPGKMFRHLILCALVQATPSISTLGVAQYYDSGLVLHQRASYWPQRTVLGRVLGGSQDMVSCCGWIGPAPAPRGTSSHSAINGWVFISTEKACIPTPVVTPLIATTAQPPEDPNNFIIPTPPTQEPNHRGSVLKHINLDMIVGNQTVQAFLALVPGLAQEAYRASLDFEINGAPVRYTLYKNPIFVTAPPCVGTHPTLRSVVEKWLCDTVTVADLRTTIPEAGKLLIINALGDGDEVLARAWCAEHGKNAIVRKNEPGLECCLTCACTLADSGNGLNVHVVIWSK